METNTSKALDDWAMTQRLWNALTPAQRDAVRDLSNLTPELIGHEGWRVEVVTSYGETRRFIVSRSTGWKPIHIEVARRNSSGGPGAERSYKSVRRLYNVRGLKP